MNVIFYFDPACPWTWRASRWVVEVSAERDLLIEWRPLSLYHLNKGEAPEEYREAMTTSHQALRVIESLHELGRNDDAGRFYTEIGLRVHEEGHALNADTVHAAGIAAGLTEKDLEALDDESWAAKVIASTEKAIATAGPGVGSPVFTVDGRDRGLHGPIISEVPRGADALQMWDSIIPLLQSSVFFEIKRGRS